MGYSAGKRDRIDSAGAEIVHRITAMVAGPRATSASQTSLPFSAPPSLLSSASKVAFRPCPQLLQGAQLGSRLLTCFLSPADSLHRWCVVRTDFFL